MSKSKENSSFSREDYLFVLQITIQKYGREHLYNALIGLFTSNLASSFPRDINPQNIIARDIILDDVEKSKKEILKIGKDYSKRFPQNLDKSNIEEICKLIAENLPYKELLPSGSVTSVKERASNMKKTQVMALLTGCDGLDYSYTQKRSIGNMQLASNKGLYKKNQEDAGVIMQHPDLPEFKLLVVADGIGGLDNGEFASTFIIEQIQNWFQNLPKEYYTSSCNTQLEQNIQKKINQISKDINKKFNKAGSTFLAAIIRDQDIKIASAGDSLAFGYKNGTIRQLNHNDSYVVNNLYNQKKLPEIKNIDDLRFHKDSNIVLNSLGSDDFDIILNFSTASKDETIILTTDGVTDCLSIKDLEDVLSNLKTDKETLAEAIVKRSTDGSKSLRPSYLDNYSKDYYSQIPRGKDNSTVAVYIPNTPQRPKRTNFKSR